MHNRIARSELTNATATQAIVYDGCLQVASLRSSTSPFNSSYEYEPFGTLTAQRGESAAANP